MTFNKRAGPPKPQGFSHQNVPPHKQIDIVEDQNSPSDLINIFTQAKPGANGEAKLLDKWRPSRVWRLQAVTVFW